MYKLEKTILSLALGVVISSTNGFAQATKKPVAAPATQKKAPVSAAPAVAKPVVLKNGLDSLSAAIGVSFTGSVMQQGIEGLSPEILTQTISKSLKGEKTIFTPEQANEFIGAYFNKKAAEQGAEVRIAGEKFLEENKTKPGIITTASGMQYQVIKMGEGAKPTASDKVKTHYHGTLIDGTVFDSSVDRGEPIEFPVGGVIKGWTEALQLMPVGSKFKLFLPYNLAYGERAAGPKIPAYSALIFDVELLEIVK